MIRTIGKEQFKEMLSGLPLTLTDDAVNDLVVGQGWRDLFMTGEPKAKAAAKSKAIAAPPPQGAIGGPTVMQLLRSSAPAAIPKSSSVPAVANAATVAVLPPPPVPVADSSAFDAGRSGGASENARPPAQGAVPKSAGAPEAGLQEPICIFCQDTLLASGQEVRAFTCGHTFHAECVNRWLQSNPIAARRLKCPVCRQPQQDDAAAADASMEEDFEMDLSPVGDNGAAMADGNGDNGEPQGEEFL